jgi:hypothetical protein
MTYNIEIKEEWYKEPQYGKLRSKWNWFVYDENYQLLDQGSSDWGEADARLKAERAATLDYKQQKAKRVEYSFTPED